MPTMAESGKSLGVARFDINKPEQLGAFVKGELAKYEVDCVVALRGGHRQADWLTPR